MVTELRSRFALGLNDTEFVKFANQLIADAVGSWRSKHYDLYQYFFNGIR